MDAPDAAPPQPRHPPLERAVEQVIFASRWLLAPIYLGLIVALIALLVSFTRRCVSLAGNILHSGTDEVIIGILSLIDIALMGGLVLMVMFAAYENFVSQLDVGNHKDRPGWMGHVGFSDLKLKLLASIVAISAIHLLENFMNISHLANRDLAWATGIHMCFVVSGVLLALMDRLMEGRSG